MKTTSNRLIHSRTEQSPVYALLRKSSFIDYPGRLCRVLFVSGCNLRCKYCHNYDLIEPKKNTITWDRLDDILSKSRENWIDAVCITGGEPTIHPRLKNLVLWLKESGFNVKLDTNGTRPETLKEFLPLVDYVAMDYKATLDGYRRITGRSNLCLERIRECKELLLEWDGEYEFRTTVIEGFHTEEDIKKICSELEGARRYVLQAYVPSPGVSPESGLPEKRTSITLLRHYQSLCMDYFEESILRGD